MIACSFLKIYSFKGQFYPLSECRQDCLYFIIIKMEIIQLLLYQS